MELQNPAESNPILQVSTSLQQRGISAPLTQDALRIGENAYYAKTEGLLILVALQAFGVPFGLAFGLAFVGYAITTLIFFGLTTATVVYMGGAVALLASYFVKWPAKLPQPQVKL